MDEFHLWSDGVEYGHGKSGVILKVAGSTGSRELSDRGRITACFENLHFRGFMASCDRHSTLRFDALLDGAWLLRDLEPRFIN